MDADRRQGPGSWGSGAILVLGICLLVAPIFLRYSGPDLSAQFLRPLLGDELEAPITFRTSSILDARPTGFVSGRQDPGGARGSRFRTKKEVGVHHGI